MKKTVSFLLAILTVCTCFGTFPVSAAGEFDISNGVLTAYVRDGGIGNGTSEQDAAPALLSLMQGLAETYFAASYTGTKPQGVQIVLVGDTTVSCNAAAIFTDWRLPATVIKGKTADVKLIFDVTYGGDIRFISDTKDLTFANLTMVARGSGNVTLLPRANKLTLGLAGEPVQMNYAHDVNGAIDASACKYFNINVTSNNKAPGQVILNSGEYMNVYAIADNYTQTLASGSSHLEVNAGAVVHYLMPTQIGNGYKPVLDGAVSITVNGGEVKHFRFINTSSPNGKLTVTGRYDIKLIGDAKVSFQTVGGAELFQSSDQSTVENGMYFAGGVTVDASALSDARRDKIKAELDTIRSNGIAGLRYYDYISRVIGMQKGKSADGTKKAVRFIIGLSEYQGISASVNIAVTAEDPADNRVFDVPLTEVYTSVLADTANGIKKEVRANELGVDYLAAVSVKDIPKEVVITSFEVTPTAGGVIGDTAVCDENGSSEGIREYPSLSPKKLAELIASVGAGMPALNQREDIGDLIAYNDPAVKAAYAAISEGVMPNAQKGDFSSAVLNDAAIDSIYTIYCSAESRLAKIAALNLYKKARMAVYDERYDAAAAEKLYDVVERIKAESRAQFTGRSDVTPGTTVDADPNESYYKYANGTFVREVTIKSNKEGMSPLEIIQISDIHQKWINADDQAQNDPALMETANNRLPYYETGRTGEELDYAAMADLTVLTGDVIDYLSYGTLEVSQRDLFEADVNMLASVGNHEFSRDFASTENKDTSTLQSRRDLLEQYWCNDIDYHSQVLGERVLVIVMNNALLSYTAEQYEKLSADLRYARDNELIVLLFQHVPLNTGNADDEYVEFVSIGDVGGAESAAAHNYHSNTDHIGNTAKTTGSTAQVYDLIRSSADVIKGIFCGHEHQDVYTEILGTNEAGTADGTVIPQYVLKGDFYSGNGILMKIIVE